MEMIKLSEITEFIERRKVNKSGVELLTKSIKENGFLINNPVVIVPIHGGKYKLIDGRHRYEGALSLGIKEMPVVVKDNLSDMEQYQLASVCNNAAETIVPNNLVSDAEFIWAKLAETKDGKRVYTQADVGVMLSGWSRDKVKNYARLESIAPPAWDVIGTEFYKSVPTREDAHVPTVGTGVPISENLLRNILDLTETHQLQMIDGLISGKLKPSQVKKRAQEYRDRETFALYAIENLIDGKDTAEIFQNCIDGLYSTQTQVEKAVKIANDICEERNQVRVIHGDCLSALPALKNRSVDILVTDPPYYITGEKWDQFNSTESFLDFTREWLKLAVSKVRDTGRIYICWSQKYMYQFPFDVIPSRFIFGNTLIWNYKNNVKPNDQHKYKYTYEPIFYFYGKDATNLNLPKSEVWDEFMNDYDVFTIAQPQSNFKDKKEHPTQKPEALITQLIRVGSDIGDTVLDCFAGAGTTGVSAKSLKRKAILIEKDAAYVKIIIKRIGNDRVFTA